MSSSVSRSGITLARSEDVLSETSTLFATSSLTLNVIFGENKMFSTSGHGSTLTSNLSISELTISLKATKVYFCFPQEITSRAALSPLHPDNLTVAKYFLQWPTPTDVVWQRCPPVTGYATCVLHMG